MSSIGQVIFQHQVENDCERYTTNDNTCRDRKFALGLQEPFCALEDDHCRGDKGEDSQEGGTEFGYLRVVWIADVRNETEEGQ